MIHVRRVAALLNPLLASLLLSAVLSGCGNPGSPQAPSLMLPQPVTDLSVSRTADFVSLNWTMPRRTTDHLLLKGDQRVVICRAEGPGTCIAVEQLLLEAGLPGAATDTLPSALSTGPLRLLRYEVRLENHARRDAGSSNPAYTAAGWAPPAARAASATATRKGIDVRWDAPAAAPEQVPSPGARLLVRLERDRILHHGESEKAGSQELQAGVPQPMQQKLEAPEHAPAAGQPWLPGSTLDANAQLNRSYRYTVQLIEQATLDQHTLEIAGAPAQTPTLDARDLFPPAVPEDVTAVANAEGGTIDLSWSVSPDLDTAGYVIYRRTADTRAEPVRVSGDKPLPTAAWSDKGATKGVRYAYSVAAVDASGNVSARSAESIETLPQ